MVHPPFWFGYLQRPVYTYKYQVADEDAQTYIAQEEERDGSAVTGQYSYVDANGSLVTVTYQADGINGYTEERTVQENYITIRARPVKEPQPVFVSAPAEPPQNDDLVARIIAALQPHIQRTLTASLGTRGNVRTVQTVAQPIRRVTVAQPVQRVQTAPVPVSRSSSSTSSIFGADGVNRIQVDTPVYQFDSFLS